jgi:hypothetical protein
MKVKALLFRTALVALPLTAAACTFDHSNNIVAPSVPALPSSPAFGGGSGPLTGIWASEQQLTLPASWTCGNFQWNVTSQTESSLAGDFSALCAGIVAVSGSASGQLNGNEVPLVLSGIASVQGIITCPFSLSGTGHIEDNDTMRVPYSGETCLGPVHGEEVLRRPGSGTPAAPPPPPPPAGNPHHVGGGPLSADRAEQVVRATADEFAHLRAPRGTESEAVSAAEELLLRTIWHLRLAGYNAGRQRNPSGAISNDKLTIHIDGAWRAFDVFYDYGRPNTQMQIIFLEVFPAHAIDYPGIPD